MKKLMIVYPYFYPHIGGAENYILNIIERLKEKYEIVVVTTNHETNKNEISIIKGFKTYRLNVWFNISHTPINLLWYSQIKEIIKKEDPDIINAHMPVPFMTDLVVRLAQNKTILTYHNDVVKEGLLGSISIIYNFTLGYSTLKNCKTIIATSNDYVENSKYLQRFKEKISIISPGVDLEKYNPKLKKGFLKNSKENKITFVGQLSKFHKHKGLEYLIQAIKLLENEKIHLYVCGKGDLVEKYKKLCIKFGIANKVSFLGFVKDDDLPKIYADSNIVVLPSYNKAEGFGMVLAEANACGIPVIGTNVGGIPVVIENGFNGLLVHPRDSEALAEAINKIIHDKALAKKLGENGTKKVKELWDWKKLAKKTEEVFER